MYSLFSSPAKLKAGVRRSERGVCDRVSFLHVQELVHTGAGGYLRSDVPRGEIREREREREREAETETEIETMSRVKRQTDKLYFLYNCV